GPPGGGPASPARALLTRTQYASQLDARHDAPFRPEFCQSRQRSRHAASRNHPEPSARSGTVATESPVGSHDKESPESYGDELPVRSRKPGAIVVSWLTTTDHKPLGKLYHSAVFSFFVLGGIMALVLRAEVD